MSPIRPFWSPIFGKSPDDTDHGQKVVYVVGKDNVAEKREVELGGMHDGLREIVSGIRAGEQVIVDGIQRVHAGAKVNPKTVDMPGLAEVDSEPASKKSPLEPGKVSVALFSKFSVPRVMSLVPGSALSRSPLTLSPHGPRRRG